MKMRTTLILLFAASIAVGCRSSRVEHSHAASIKVVNVAGEGQSGVELYAVYPVSSQTVRTTTGADGVGIMAFPPGPLVPVLVSMRNENSVLGQVVIHFDGIRTNIAYTAVVGYYTELDLDGRVLTKREMTARRRR